MRPIYFLVAILLIASLSFAQADEATAEKIAKNAAKRLGWPETTTTGMDDIPGKAFLIAADDKGEDSEVKGYVTVLSSSIESGMYLTLFEQQLMMQRSSFLGRDAVILKAHKECNPTGLVKVVSDFFKAFFESILGPSDSDNCVDMHGAIVWSCGKYLFVAADETDSGIENDVASAFYAAAEEEHLCEYGDTVVLMADTTDRPGAQNLPKFQEMAQKVNEFYGVNSYAAQAPFKYTFLDADGSRGTDDWYTIDQPLASFNYPNGNYPFAVDAIKKAFNGSDLSEDLYLERVVVVFAGDGHQADATAKFSNACSWLADNHFVEVQASSGTKKVFVKNIILLSENRLLGAWVHEFGHSLWSSHALPGNWNRISDRYNYDATTSPDRQYGETGPWDLMGSGSHWGANGGDDPTQMSGFTKNSAGWLGYTEAALNNTYRIKSIESMKKDENVLRFDDPQFANAEYYYTIEARDSSAVFGAPESGVVIYRVWFDQGHHVVNDLVPQGGATVGAGPGGRQFRKATLTDTAGNASRYISVPGQFQISLVSQATGPYAARVKVEEYKPAALVGAVAAPAGGGVAGGAPAGTTENDLDGTMPDTDLHAYDAQGNHVGMDYQTGEYENEIPGAIASGDLIGAEEWIFVPEGTDVRYEISGHDTQQFLGRHPELAQNTTPEISKSTMIRFDASGNRFEADAGNVSVSSGQNVQLKSPTDPSLKYEKKGIPGAGNNSLCPFFPAFIGLLSLFIFKR